MAQCPAHADRTPSLAITQIEGQILVHCHGGCHNDDVLAELSLGKRDFYDNPRGAEYPYRDATGRLARTVFRSPEKKFRQDIVINGVVPLYHLDSVMAAVKAGRPVLVVEGEKDVHAGESQDVAATTAPGGAPNWAQADYEPLRGASNVSICADRDEAGLKRAAALQRHLTDITGHHVPVLAAAEGNDLSDHIAAGRGIDELVPVSSEDLGGVETPTAADRPQQRELILTSAADIKPRRVFWLWDGRIALGTLALLAGLQGLGKSTLAYWIAAQITLGTLHGEFYGTPRSVLVCATEDSWEHTIVPRLIAAGADLTKVYRVEVLNADEIHVGLSLPRDNHAMEKAALATGAAALLLDPLISRLGDLDTHKDSEVRQALEPLVAVAARTQMAILGLIHHNKSGSADPLHLVMGSTAFSAVARSVHTVIRDPDDDTDTKRLFGTPKNNLGRTNLPTLSFTVESHAVHTEEGIAWTGRVLWGGEHDGSIADAMSKARDTGDDRSLTKEAADWLEDFLTIEGPEVPSVIVKRKAKDAGHSESTLRRAKLRLRVVDRSTSDFPRKTMWSLPLKTSVSSQSSPRVRGDELTELTELTGAQPAQSVQWLQPIHVTDDPDSLKNQGAGQATGGCRLHSIVPKPHACYTCALMAGAEQEASHG